MYLASDNYKLYQVELDSYQVQDRIQIKMNIIDVM